MPLLTGGKIGVEGGEGHRIWMMSRFSSRSIDGGGNMSAGKLENYALRAPHILPSAPACHHAPSAQIIVSGVLLRCL